jgi:SAM-dependent methyltransferase
MQDLSTARAFYATARGAVAARLLRARLLGIWPSLARESVLGIGFPTPYLRLWREEAYRCVAVTPVQLGPWRWPRSRPCLTCMAEEDALPFPDLSFDRVLLVHGLEVAENARRMLRESWRVLKDDGRLLVVAPNRAGLWAHLETTPFGHGQPYSAGQIERLLAATMFRVERRDTALYVPPLNWRLVLRAAPLVERIGHRLMPSLAGLTLTEAVKDVYAVIPAAAVARQRRVVLVDAA